MIIPQEGQGFQLLLSPERLLLQAGGASKKLAPKYPWLVPLDDRR